MGYSKNKQKIIIEWVEGVTREVDVVLHTWFLGVHTSEVLAVAGSIDDAIERANRYQVEHGITEPIEHRKKTVKKYF